MELAKGADNVKNDLFSQILMISVVKDSKFCVRNKQSELDGGIHKIVTTVSLNNIINSQKKSYKH